MRLPRIPIEQGESYALVQPGGAGLDLAMAGFLCAGGSLHFLVPSGGFRGPLALALPRGILIEGEATHRHFSPPSGYELPIKIPVKNTSTPPTTTWNAACKKGVSIYLCRTQLITPSSTATTRMATVIANRKSLIRKGNVWPSPPAVVMAPVTIPRIQGEPRPVSEPSSDKPSANAIDIPAPSDAAIPTRKASQVLCVA